MRINFPDTAIIDESAKRLHDYLSSQHHNITIDNVRNIICRCYQYSSYNDLQSNLSKTNPQLNSLTQENTVRLKNQQLEVLGNSLPVENDSAKDYWMAMTPYVELRSNKRLLAGEIGRHTYEWNQPDEYGDGTGDVNIYTFVIGVICKHCNGRGKLVPEIKQQDLDMNEPPEYSDEMCQDCDGTGVYHYRPKKLNTMRLSTDELHLHNEYYDSLDDDFL